MYEVGARVIFTSPLPEFDGRRGTVTQVRAGGLYDVRFDDGEEWPNVWESKLDREADNPDYPQPRKAL